MANKNNNLHAYHTLIKLGNSTLFMNYIKIIVLVTVLL